jgi:hypothetical protein
MLLKTLNLPSINCLSRGGMLHCSLWYVTAHLDLMVMTAFSIQQLPQGGVPAHEGQTYHLFGDLNLGGGNDNIPLSLNQQTPYNNNQ